MISGAVVVNVLDKQGAKKLRDADVKDRGGIKSKNHHQRLYLD